MFKYQVIRYLFAGALSFVFDVSVLYYVTDVLKIHYLLGAMAGFTAGSAVNYFLSISWVFNHRSCKCQETEFIIFFGIGIIGLGLNEFFMWLFTNLAGIYPILSKCLTTVVVFFWNYYSRKVLLFRATKMVEAVRMITHEEG